MFPIDIVYLWVDGSDKKWIEARDFWYNKTQTNKAKNISVKNKSLYRDNGELKYSLRSVAECVPWVNHIYIITGFNQVPKWLNTKNPKISIIPHEQIIPHKALPTFNSVSIEMCVPNIKNLSEHFILMNDDTIFNKKLNPGFFYDAQKRAIVRYNYNKHHMHDIDTWIQKSDIYTSTILSSAKIIDKLYNKKLYSLYPSHGIDPYLKSNWLQCIKEPQISPKIQKQIQNKFRKHGELQRWLINLYDYVHNRAVFKKTHGYKSGKHKVSNFLYNTIHWYSVRHSPVFCFDAEYSKQSLTHSAIFCINDSPDSTAKTRQANKNFLQQRFPNKCEFEK